MTKGNHKGRIVVQIHGMIAVQRLRPLRKNAGTFWSQRVSWWLPGLKSSAAARMQRQVPNLRQDARHLHSIQLVDEGKHLGNVRVFHQVANFFLAVALAPGQQVGDATSSARASRSSEESVGVAFSFSILET